MIWIEVLERTPVQQCDVKEEIDNDGYKAALMEEAFTSHGAKLLHQCTPEQQTEIASMVQCRSHRRKAIEAYARLNGAMA